MVAFALFSANQPCLMILEELKITVFEFSWDPWLSLNLAKHAVDPNLAQGLQVYNRKGTVDILEAQMTNAYLALLCLEDRLNWVP